MEKIRVTPTEKNKLYVHPETKVEFPSGKVIETEKDWFVNAKLSLGHLKEVKGEVADDVPKAGEQNGGDGQPFTLEAFEQLSADDQKHELVRLQLAESLTDEKLSNKEKRVALYETFLNGAGE